MLCRTHCKVLGVANGGFPFEIAKTDIVIIITIYWTKYDMSNRCALRLKHPHLYIRSTLSDLILGQSNLPECLSGTRDRCVVQLWSCSFIRSTAPSLIYIYIYTHTRTHARTHARTHTHTHNLWVFLLKKNK